MKFIIFLAVAGIIGIIGIVSTLIYDKRHGLTAQQ